MPDIDISIVIVHWNVPDLLEQCLTSVDEERCRSHLRTETIIVDSASPDQRWLEVARQHADTRCICMDANRGYAAAGNAGIEASSGGAVLILNPDTILQPGSLEALHAALQISPHIGLVAPLLLNPDNTVQSTGYRFPGIRNVLLDVFPLHPRLVESTWNGRVHPGDGELPYAIDYPLGAAMLVRREALEQAGGLDESYFMYSEEIDFCQRLATRGWTRLLAPRAGVVHLGGQSTSQQPVEMYEALWRSRARYHRRWSPGWKRLAIRAMVSLGTRLDDRLATPARKVANRSIRRHFAEAAR